LHPPRYAPILFGIIASPLTLSAAAAFVLARGFTAGTIRRGAPFPLTQ